MTAIRTLMSSAGARQFRQDHDNAARHLSRKSKGDLEKIAAGFRERICGQSSKDELISEILGHRYPAGRLNEAIHVLHHAPGEAWSACEICMGVQA
jgi:hypothetical protein